MRIAPTLDGGLRIDAESATDWLVLEMICTDAANLPGKPLTERLAAFMKTDDDWKEFVTPDIQNTFNEQITHVSKALCIAEKDQDLIGSLYIKKEEADTWFGAINQARLSLEAQYRLSAYDGDEEIDPTQTHIKSAQIRYEFYNSLQTLLLEYLMQ